jgi:hypothetical protein
MIQIKEEECHIMTLKKDVLAAIVITNSYLNYS